LITALSNQVDKERDRADRMATELTNYHEASRAIRQTQQSFRIKRVIYSDNLKLRSKELKDTVARMEAEMAELRERYEESRSTYRGSERENQHSATPHRPVQGK